MSKDELWIVIQDVPAAGIFDREVGVWMVKAATSDKAKWKIIEKSRKGGYLIEIFNLKARRVAKLRDGMKIL